MSSNIVAIIPVKSHSERVPGKNFRLLAGRPLFAHITDTALRAGFAKVYLDTDSREVKDYAAEHGAGVIDRPAWLAVDGANGNHLLNYQASVVEADIYVQLFATAPLLTEETIRRAVSILTEDEQYDSSLTVSAVHSWFWFDGRPINYDPRVLPRSQDARPVIRETTGLYAIRRESLLRRQCRIGDRPYFLPIDDAEALDIDSEFDFRIAEILMQERSVATPDGRT